MQVSRKLFLPQSISLYITDHCGSRCGHCFLVQQGRLNQHHLPLRDIQTIVEEAHAHQVFMMVISGGEPLMHPDFFRVLHLLKHKGILPLLGLTGTNLTPAHLAGLAEAGITTVQVSLDGADAASHDALRGSGHFAQVTRNIAALQDAGIKVNVATCLHQGNLRDLPDMLALLAKLTVSSVKMTFYNPYGSTSAHVRALEKAQCQQALSTAQSFMTLHGRAGWIVCPTHDIPSGLATQGKRRHVPLVIGADRSLRAGEGGELIGRLEQGPLSKVYTAFVERRIRTCLDRLLARLCRQHGVADVRTAPGLVAEGLVYHHDGYRILIREGLPSAWHYFTLLHEIGHIATGTLSVAPARHRQAATELAIDLWALDTLREHLDNHALALYQRAARAGRTALTQLVTDRLFNDFINLGAIHA